MLIDSHCHINDPLFNKDPKKYAFKPMEVTAMEWSIVSNSLRHGKMVGWRKDLTLDDCTLDKIDENL